ncbi:MAG: ATP-dependent zinc metalloprotease FtsH [Bacteroidia bacterium]|nr:ATP-dependent zinc metalloprotease FtsH [Bacteroidia bacterium]MCX7651546.1 ATP-dependent zinc metalloprotease FtsH [Bacteroidia bacterium]MDW8416258.1 ATP-dependent zinc metalloprotease FtsH [Bacteroidia bacterium]
MTNRNNRQPTFNLYWLYMLLFGLLLASFIFMPERQNSVPITYLDFQQWVERRLVKKIVIIANRGEAEVYLTPQAVELQDIQERMRKGFWGWLPFSFRVVSVEKLEEYLQQRHIPYEVTERTDYLGILLQYVLPIVLIIAVWVFLIGRMSSRGGAPGPANIFSIGRSRASVFDAENRVSITFNDVAGLAEAKQEVQEVVEFLKNPQKFTRLGGKIPKGVLLVGPPGTGKTLLAKAVAGEAGVPFFSISGSDFVEMFVGVGAARVRDLFRQAKEKAPCIIFIDEIDAVGRSRSRVNVPISNDERENTLNQLLVEMDGFNTDAGIIVMAATNRPDILDSALLRAGRFDRVIYIDRPDIKEREAIFRVHMRNLILAPDVDPHRLALQTPGFVGADIANVCNEAALIAARRERAAISMEDFHEAIDKVIGGLERRSKVISPEEKRIVAFHEAGHAVAGWFLEHADPLLKVSIIPRGYAALGYAQYLPKEQYIYTQPQLLDVMAMTLAGRAAEEIVFGQVSTGAQNDLERVTQLAYAMVTQYGMSELGNLAYRPSEETFWQRPYSEDTARKIDSEVQRIIQQAYDKARAVLQEHYDYLRKLAERLLEKEVLHQEEIEAILGPRPYGYGALENLKATS